MKILAPLIRKLDPGSKTGANNKLIKPTNNSAYFYLNKQGIITRTSKSFREIGNYKKGALSGKPIKAIVHYKSLNQIYNVIDSLSEENPFYKVKTKIRNLKGNLLDVEMFLSLTSLKKNASIFVIIRLSGTHIENYDNLFKKKEKLRILSENTNYVELLFNASLKCEYISSSCEKLLGYHSSEIIDKNLYHYIHPEDFEMVWEIFNIPNIVDELTIHYRIKRKDELYIIVEARIKRLYDDFGKINNYAVYLNDASKQKKYEKQLVLAKRKAIEASETKTNFLASISHEFRTPLNSIIGYSNILNSALTDNCHAEYAKIIENSGMQLLDMVNNILSYSQIEQNKIPVNLTDVSLIQFTNKLESELKTNPKNTDKKDVELIAKWKYSEEKRIIHTDIDLLFKIMQNLIGNAIKFTPKGFVKYGCKCDKKNSIIFYVKDSGIGIPKKYQKKIFDRFTQQDGSLTKQFDGTGIGLAVTKKIVKLLNGKIWVESQLGKGSTFFIKLPVKF